MTNTLRRLAPCLLACAATLRAAATSAQTVDAQRAWDDAARLERVGQFRDAARALAPLRAAYPDDYAVALQLGWLAFQAGDYEPARGHYRHALALSDQSSVEARLGLAWSLLRLRDAPRARREFDRVLARDPANASARQGAAMALAAEPRALRVWASLVTTTQALGNHPARGDAFGVSPGVLVELGDLVLLGASYRYLRYDYRSAVGANATTYEQHEVHASVGVARPGFTLRAHFGYVADAANPLAPAYAFGLSARVALHGALDLEASGTAFADYTVARVAAAWGIALSDAWSLGPTASAQYGNGAAGGSVGARLGFTSRVLALAVAGRYGDERRPTFLNDATLYATNDRIQGALAATARVPLGGGFALALGYEWQRLALDATSGATEADVHYFTAGLTGAW